jgi:branched-subunit amino acid ABC-type transport system permease component
MDLGATLILQTMGAVATIAIFSVGLAVIFGMMRVINLAHGEFIMLGGYAAVIATRHGLNLWLSILVVSPLVVGVFGLIVERLLISRLYGRMIDTLLATWGLSLFLIGLVTLVFGNTMVGLPTPLGGMQVGAYRMGVYNLFLIVVAIAIFAAIYFVLTATRFGLMVRATMQNAEMTAALGINPRKLYSVTFGIGAALAGLAGGLMAPTTGVIPTMGGAFIAKAFITVICGGPAIIAGSAVSASLFGVINQFVSYISTPVFGEAALLIAAIVLLGIMPGGISAKLFRGAS